MNRVDGLFVIRNGYSNPTRSLDAGSSKTEDSRSGDSLGLDKSQPIKEMSLVWTRLPPDRRAECLAHQLSSDRTIRLEIPRRDASGKYWVFEGFGCTIRSFGKYQLLERSN